jgi:hypothetical protein
LKNIARFAASVGLSRQWTAAPGAWTILKPACATAVLNARSSEARRPVVATRYRAGAEWKPARLSSGQATVELMANTVPAQERPQETLRALSRAAGGAIVLQSDRGEAGAVAQELLDMLSA